MRRKKANQITKKRLNELVNELNNLVSGEQYRIIRERTGYCLLNVCPLNAGIYGFWDILTAREMFSYVKGVITAIKAYNN